MSPGFIVLLLTLQAFGKQLLIGLIDVVASFYKKLWRKSRYRYITDLVSCLVLSHEWETRHRDLQARGSLNS